MEIDILTMFPDMLEGYLSSPLVLRARQKKIAEVRAYDLKSYTKGSFRRIDDSPYGGGAGTLIRVDAVYRALQALDFRHAHVVLLSPSGTPYTQKKAGEFTRHPKLLLLAGHYEGFDQRVFSLADEAVSVGDYVLSGGEIPAMAVADSVLRLLPGILQEGSLQEESFQNNLLEYPQYTRPASFLGMEVPEVLLSGNHEEIRKWRREESLRKTRERRPDLIEKDEEKPSGQ